MQRWRSRIAPLDLSKNGRENPSHGVPPPTTASARRIVSQNEKPSLESSEERTSQDHLNSSSSRPLENISQKERLYQVNDATSESHLMSGRVTKYDTNKDLPPTPLELVNSKPVDTHESRFPLTFGDLEYWDSDSPSSLVFTVDRGRDSGGPRFVIIPQTALVDVNFFGSDEDEFPLEILPPGPDPRTDTSSRSSRISGPQYITIPQTVTLPVDVDGLGDENEYTFETLIPSPRTGTLSYLTPTTLIASTKKASIEKTLTERNPLPSPQRQNRSGGLFAISPVDGSFVQVKNNRTTKRIATYI